MNWVIKSTKWASIAVIFFCSIWIAFLSYFAQAFTKGALERVLNGELEVSLATGALISRP